MNLFFNSELYSLKPRAVWSAFATDNFAFWMSCCYLIFEYIRPHAIWSGFEVYPYWARTFLILAFLGWTLDSRRQLIWTKTTSKVFAFLILITLSSYNAYWPSISWNHYMDYFNWVVVFFVLTQTVTTRTRFYILVLIFMLASFKLSMYGARTWAARGFGYADWGLAGPRGFFNNPGELAIQMLMFGPIALFFILGIKQHLSRLKFWILCLMPLTAVMTILGTNTRGGQLALAVQLLALLMLSKHRIKALILVGFIAVIGFSFLPEEQKSRYDAAGSDSTSIQRILYWKHGWEMIKDHPVLGVGYFNFSQYYNVKHADDLVLGRGKPAELPHNIFIQVGTDTGFTGLVLFLLILGGAYWTTFRLKTQARAAGDVFTENMATGMNISLIGFVVAGQFVTVTYYPFLWIHLVLLTSMTTFLHNEKHIRDSSAMESRSSVAFR
jgi:putative inorganic carbon (hco3(-)) transporter